MASADAVESQDLTPTFVDTVSGLAFDSGRGSGFPFAFTRPTDPNYFGNGDIHNDISTKLAEIGLNCADNTPDKIGNYAQDVYGFYSAGTFQWLVNTRPSPAVDFSVHFGGPPHRLLREGDAHPFRDSANQVHGGAGGVFTDKLILMMRDMKKLGGIMTVSHTSTENHFESSSIGAITEVFKQAGNFIGTLQNGQRVQPAQIANLVSDALKSLTETTKRDWETHKKDVMVGMVPSETGEGAQMLTAVYYTYDATVNDYKDKKHETKRSWYKVENWSVVFSSEEIFDYVWKKFIE